MLSLEKQWKILETESIENFSVMKKKLKKYFNKPSFKDSIIFNENLVVIMNNVTSILFNKPIYTGMCILD